MSTSAPSPVRALQVAAVLLGLESLAAVVFAVLEATHVSAVRLVMGVGVTLIMLGFGVLLALVARGVARARRWSRGLAVVTQLILLLLGYSFRQPPTTLAGFAMAALAFTVLVCLLLPASTRAFVGDDALR
jgi:peptidoglycan/LPS O-acetylase OafA/YrhL